MTPGGRAEEELQLKTSMETFLQLVNVFKQMEEKKRKQAEERERLKILEEKEAKRLAMERAHIQQRYEDEQRREKEIRVRALTTSHQLPSQHWISYRVTFFCFCRINTNGAIKLKLVTPRRISAKGRKFRVLVEMR
ncbi:hypothetical protein GOODEAATRI_008796 [Goodea atripinnis]|uniref:Uncharacterized protein n=1 Tax=Goodea atripinnis TaxID=208336 RepID=A0ABV0NU26_9TELE